MNNEAHKPFLELVSRAFAAGNRGDFAGVEASALKADDAGLIACVVGLGRAATEIARQRSLDVELSTALVDLWGRTIALEELWLRILRGERSVSIVRVAHWSALELVEELGQVYLRLDLLAGAAQALQTLRARLRAGAGDRPIDAVCA